MNPFEEILLAIMSVMTPILLTAIWWLASGAVKTRNDVDNLLRDNQSYAHMDARVTRIEVNVEWTTRLLHGLEKASIENLHNPDDHLNMDALVDKYVANNDDLPIEDWIRVYEICQIIQLDPLRNRPDCALARLAQVFAAHKLSRFTGHPLYEKFKADQKERRLK